MDGYPFLLKCYWIYTFLIKCGKNMYHRTALYHEIKNNNEQAKKKMKEEGFFEVLPWKEQGVTSVKTHIFSCKAVSTLHAK